MFQAFRAVLVAVFALALSPSTIAQPTTAPATRPSLRVLFVGNSYTAFNGGLPHILREFAAARGKTIETAGSIRGGKSLQWHWEEGTAREMIDRGGWDVVVLQKYSTRPITEPEKMFKSARLLDAEIKKTGARTLFYMTWARQHQPENQAVLTNAYEKIAAELRADVAPVGRAWQRVLSERPDLALHTPDKSHPTPAGTYLAACVFYAKLLDDSPVGLPSAISKASTKPSITLQPEVAAYLQRIAETVVRERAPTTAPSALQSPAGSRNK
jgi:hypothetical protein